MVVKMIGRMKVGHKCQSCEVKGKEKRMCENTDFLRQENWDNNQLVQNDLIHFAVYLKLTYYCK